MTTNIVSKADASFAEAPASWNVRYCTAEGFCCQLTLRAESGKDLLEKAGIALAYLLQQGYKPEENHRGFHNNNGQGERKICPVHQCDMKRYEKDGRSWFSHKIDDGNWCRGKAKGG